MGNLDDVKKLILVARWFALFVLALCAAYWVGDVVIGITSGNFTNNLIKTGHMWQGVTFLPVILGTLVALMFGAPTYFVFDRTRQMKHAADLGDKALLSRLTTIEWVVAGLLFSGVLPGLLFLVIHRSVPEPAEGPSISAPPSPAVIQSPIQTPRGAPSMSLPPSFSHALDSLKALGKRKSVLDSGRPPRAESRPAGRSIPRWISDRGRGLVTPATPAPSPAPHPTAAVEATELQADAISTGKQDVSEVGAQAQSPDTSAPAASTPVPSQDVIKSRVRVEETWKCPNCARMADAPAGKSAKYKCRNCGQWMTLAMEVWRCPNCLHEAAAPVGKSDKYKCRRCGTPMSLISRKNP